MPLKRVQVFALSTFYSPVLRLISNGGILATKNFNISVAFHNYKIIFILNFYFFCSFRSSNLFKSIGRVRINPFWHVFKNTKHILENLWRSKKEALRNLISNWIRVLLFFLNRNGLRISLNRRWKWDIIHHFLRSKDFILSL